MQLLQISWMDQISQNLIFIFQDVIDYTWCLKVPPRCRTYRTKLVTRWREENVTRVVNVRSCCPGTVGEI